MECKHDDAKYEDPKAVIIIDRLTSDNAKLRKKLLFLSGKTNFCPQCEGYAKEIERLNVELAALSEKHGLTVLKYAEGSHQYEAACKDRDQLKAELGKLLKRFEQRVSLIPNLQAELETCKRLGSKFQGELISAYDARDHWKALAGKMAEALKFPISYLKASDPDEEDGLHAIYVLEDALAAFDACVRLSGQNEYKTLIDQSAVKENGRSVAREAEQLYSGQCRHQIPIGQPCPGCNL